MNCTENDAGECHLAATVDITAPDGTPYGDQLAFDTLKGPNNLPTNMIGLTPNGIGLIIEDEDQLGRYRIELNVKDVHSDLTATSVVHIEAVEADETE